MKWDRLCANVSSLEEDGEKLRKQGSCSHHQPHLSTALPFVNPCFSTLVQCKRSPEGSSHQEYISSEGSGKLSPLGSRSERHHGALSQLGPYWKGGGHGSS